MSISISDSEVKFTFVKHDSIPVYLVQNTFLFLEP